MAEGGGIEPPTTELTVPCSTAELPFSKKMGLTGLEPATNRLKGGYSNH